ncbi:MAG: 3-phosphoshikimate 1-carboxyvinyltransferase [Chlamydiae bacterium]|nr:3-phosphoshikimate 1-carboxyvinyltransferase [Chlamydiota bacterium]
MPSLVIHPSTLSGTLTVPPSKSHTMRALVFALMGRGYSDIYHYLDSPDTDAMIEAIQLLGAKVARTKEHIQILGTSGKLISPSKVIEAGNSGQVLRFIGALLPHTEEGGIITGDASICSLRPSRPLMEGLSGLGATCTYYQKEGFAPFHLKGPWINSTTTLCGIDSQPVSALLISGSFLPYPSTIRVRNPGETPWIDLTLWWMERLGVSFTRKGYEEYHLAGKARYDGFKISIPGDFSSAAFGIAASIITHQPLLLRGLDRHDVQGDKILIEILKKMGADIQWIDEHTLAVKNSTNLQGGQIDINSCIDALPILSVIGCFAKGSTHILNGKIARNKESDRISCIVSELRKMGALIDEREDGLTIHHSPLTGACVNSHKDHRIALSLAIASMGAKGRSCIQDTECINKTYKEFVNHFKALGCSIEEL